jgi:hypothetical protein
VLRNRAPLAAALTSSAPTRNGLRPYLSMSRPKTGENTNSESAPEAVRRARVDEASAGSPMMRAIIIGREARVVQKQKTERKVAGPRILSGFSGGAASLLLLWAAMSAPPPSGTCCSPAGLRPLLQQWLRPPSSSWPAGLRPPPLSLT